MKYVQIMSKGVHFLVLFFIFIIAIIIIIGLVKYLVWFMPRKLSIRVDKQNGIDCVRHSLHYF